VDATTSVRAELEHGRPGVVLAALALANVMSAMDLFIVNVALNTIGSDLHHPLSNVAWQRRRSSTRLWHMRSCARSPP
jgi:hypothetical protein